MSARRVRVPVPEAPPSGAQPVTSRTARVVAFPLGRNALELREFFCTTCGRKTSWAWPKGQSLTAFERGAWCYACRVGGGATP